MKALQSDDVYDEIHEGKLSKNQRKMKRLRERITELEVELKDLRHYKATTTGLWATDRPDLIEDPKGNLFQIS